MSSPMNTGAVAAVAMPTFDTTFPTVPSPRKIRKFEINRTAEKVSDAANTVLAAARVPMEAAATRCTCQESTMKVHASRYIHDDGVKCY